MLSNIIQPQNHVYKHKRITTRKHTLSHGVQGNLNIYIEYNIEFKQKQEIIHKTQIIIQKYLSIHNATMTPNLAL